MKLVSIFCIFALTAAVFFTAIRFLPLTEPTEIAASSQVEIDRLNLQIASARDEQSEKVGTLSQKISGLEAEKLTQQSLLDAALGDLETLKAQSTQTEASDSIIAEKDAQIASLQMDLTDLKSKVDAASQELENTIASELETKQSLTGNFEREAAESAARIAELESMRAEAQTAQNDKITQLEAIIFSQTGDYKAQIATLTGELANMTNAAAQLETQQSLAGDFERKAAESAARIAELESLSAETQASQNDAIAKLETQIQTQASDYKTQIANLTGEIENLSNAAAERENTPANPELAIMSQAASCSQAINAVLDGTQVDFEDRTPTIKEASIPVLSAIATIAVDCAKQDLTLDIEAHTSIAGGIAGNLLLSNSRATAVHDFLASNGVPAKSMRPVGFGGNDPIVDNDTTAGQARNQRIVFHWKHL